LIGGVLSCAADLLENEMFNPNVGDSVRLKSGGPEMTVVEVITTGMSERPTGNLRCSWFAGKKNEKAIFPIGALEPVDAAAT
jgi:uncharacterized protein YodC (DUF2158 family)